MKEYVSRTRAEGTNLGKSFIKSIIMRIIPEPMKKTLEAQTSAMTEAGVRDYIKQQLELVRRNKPSPMEIGVVQEEAAKEHEETCKACNADQEGWTE
eukprot:11361365-Karenia_brevis.AAC.1